MADGNVEAGSGIPAEKCPLSPVRWALVASGHDQKVRHVRKLALPSAGPLHPRTTGSASRVVAGFQLLPDSSPACHLHLNGAEKMVWLCQCGMGNLVEDPPDNCPLCGFPFHILKDQEDNDEDRPF